jgi:hypothetical protein
MKPAELGQLDLHEERCIADTVNRIVARKQIEKLDLCYGYVMLDA